MTKPIVAKVLSDYIVEVYEGNSRALAKHLAGVTGKAEKDMTTAQRKRVNRLAGQLSRWQSGDNAPDYDSLCRLVEKTGLKAQDLLPVGGDRVPWKATGWPPDVRVTFAKDFFSSVADQCLAEHHEDLESLGRLADKAGEDGRQDYTLEGDVRQEVGLLAKVWLEEAHLRVRELVRGRINGRIAWHLSHLKGGGR